MSSSSTQVRAFCPACGDEFSPDTHEFCPKDGAELQTYSSVPSDRHDPLLGQTLDERFEIESIIGRGGMGKVYAGTQLSVDRSVAIKVLHPESEHRDVLIKRFFREARVISGFSHPNIVNLIEFGQDETRGYLYLVMELIEGRTLHDLLDEGRLHPELALEIAKQTCNALAEPHAEGVIHRDLKPSNLMLVPIADGRLQVKLVDFGIAHTLKRDTRLTKTGRLYGTFKYMAPERGRGQDATEFSDLYALGVILFEMLAGWPPFDAEQDPQLLMSHIEDEPPLLDGVLPEQHLPPGLEALVEALLEKDPARRPGDVQSVRERIEQIQREAGYSSTLRVDLDGSSETLFAPWLLESTRRPEAIDSDDLAPATGSEAPPSKTGDNPPTVPNDGLEETDAADSVAPTQVADSTPGSGARAGTDPSSETSREELKSTLQLGGPNAADVERARSDGRHENARASASAASTATESNAHVDGSSAPAASEHDDTEGATSTWLWVGLGSVAFAGSLGLGSVVLWASGIPGVVQTTNAENGRVPSVPTATKTAAPGITPDGVSERAAPHVPDASGATGRRRSDASAMDDTEDDATSPSSGDVSPSPKAGIGGPSAPSGGSRAPERAGDEDDEVGSPPADESTSPTSAGSTAADDEPPAETETERRGAEAREASGSNDAPSSRSSSDTPAASPDSSETAESSPSDEADAGGATAENESQTSGSSSDSPSEDEAKKILDKYDL